MLPGSLVSWAFTEVKMALGHSLLGDTQTTVTTHVWASPPLPCSVSLGASSKVTEAYHALIQRVNGCSRQEMRCGTNDPHIRRHYGMTST